MFYEDIKFYEDYGAECGSLKSRDHLTFDDSYASDDVNSSDYWSRLRKDSDADKSQDYQSPRDVHHSRKFHYSSDLHNSPESEDHSSRHGLSWPSSALVSSSSFSITPIKQSPEYPSQYSYSHSAPSHTSLVQVIPPNPDDKDQRFLFRYPSDDFLKNESRSRYPSVESTNHRRGENPRYQGEVSSRYDHGETPRYQFPNQLHSSEIFPNARLTYSQISKHYKHDDETIAGRKIFKNPRNVPSEHCPRDEEEARRLGRTCLRKCSSDSDGCLSRRKKCLCDGICGMSCIKPDKECGDLVNPLFGFVEIGGRVVGSRATYKCQEGYHLIGHAERVCQADGTWSGAPTECRENCECRSVITR
ncbi:uncharacterized protein LOC125177736 [Hyalella azteca]|uniref:Uncharacterized protein LOC125177736 n=1 Tax=Hyalella azteca TaxID=294128 RepID=A0A979FHD4_HYAAZ|nr:uncharacterized protein LOC125177736 [Hyalella azteca]